MPSPPPAWRPPSCIDIHLPLSSPDKLEALHSARGVHVSHDGGARQRVDHGTPESLKKGPRALVYHLLLATAHWQARVSERVQASGRPVDTRAMWHRNGEPLDPPQVGCCRKLADSIYESTRKNALPDWLHAMFGTPHDGKLSDHVFKIERSDTAKLSFIRSLECPKVRVLTPSDAPLGADAIQRLLTEHEHWVKEHHQIREALDERSSLLFVSYQGQLPQPSPSEDESEEAVREYCLALRAKYGCAPEETIEHLDGAEGTVTDPRDVIVDVELEIDRGRGSRERESAQVPPRPKTLRELLGPAAAPERPVRVVVYGEPGSGKSCSVQSLAYALAVERLDDPSIPLPIVIQLPTWARKRLAATARGRRATDRDPVTSERDPWGLAAHAWPTAPETIEDALTSGNVVILFDAFDEVPSDLVLATRDALREMAVLGSPRSAARGAMAMFSRYVVGCLPGSPWRTVRIKALSSERQRMVLSKWLRTREGWDAAESESLERTISERVEALHRRLNATPELRLMARTPLYLIILAGLSADEADTEADGGFDPLHHRTRASVLKAHLRALILRLYRETHDVHQRTSLAARTLDALKPLGDRLMQDASVSNDGRTWTVRELEKHILALKTAPAIRDQLERYAGSDSQVPAAYRFALDIAWAVMKTREGRTGVRLHSESIVRFRHRQFLELLAAQELMGSGPSHVQVQRIVDRAVGLAKDERACGNWAETLGIACSLLKRPVRALEELSTIAPRVVCAVVEELELPVTEALELLWKCDLRDEGAPLGELNWDGHTLCRICRRAWKRGDRSAAALRASLLNRVREELDTERLSFIHYAMQYLARLDGPASPHRRSRESFFRRCGRWSDVDLPEHQVERCYANMVATRELPTDRAFWRPIPGTEAFTPSRGPRPERDHATSRLHAFEMAACPVTHEMYELFDPGHRSRSDGTHRPVDGITWWEAYLFCQWLGAELPSELQWEYACRGPQDVSGRTKFWIGDKESQLMRVAWYGRNSSDRPHAVGEPTPASRGEVHPWGLLDLHGQVWEWCRDGYVDDAYRRSTDGVLGLRKGDDEEAEELAGRHRVLRGGCYASPSDICLSGERSHLRAGVRDEHNGFRPLRLRRAGDET